jgi:preprotein translocase subunit SecG
MRGEVIMAEGDFNANMRKNSKFKEYVSKNKFLTVSVCILVVLIIVLVIVYTSLGNDNKSASVNLTKETTTGTADVPKVEVLPQPKRETEKSKSSAADEKKKESKDPFAGPMFLKGTIIGDNGNNKAMIESEGVSYIVSVGDKVGELWSVDKIDRMEVLLKSGDKEIVLKPSEKGK